MDSVLNVRWPDGHSAARLTRPKAGCRLGALVQELARKQQDVKGDFAKTFSRFASPANQKEYRKLFADKARMRSK
jgi:hypothetical protein